MTSISPADRESDRNPQLYDLLITLGYHARERVSINTQSHGSRFVSELRTVASLAGWTPPQDRNVWFGVNPVGRHVRYGRGTEADITRVRALFADLDVKPGQSLDTLDQCYATTRQLAKYLGVAPVAMIESGHGLQPLWRVASPRGDSNVINRDRSRDELRETWWRFGTVAQNAARNSVWSPDGAHTLRTIDGVFNIDRVLRCPGSVNWKDPSKPVSVRTRLYAGGRVSLGEMMARLDRDNVTPLKRTRALVAGVPTDFGEAKQWVDAQPGATAELPELQQMPRSGVLWKYLDTESLVRLMADGEAHATMRDQVQHAVYAAQEDRAGLVVALHNIGAAYSEVMERRASGELAGEVRDAQREWATAVRGAVAKARGRVVPNVDAWTRRVDEWRPRSGATVSMWQARTPK
jgi:hypothetical protein